jgi:hypothetical protein
MNADERQANEEKETRLEQLPPDRVFRLEAERQNAKQSLAVDPS